VKPGGLFMVRACFAPPSVLIRNASLRRPLNRKLMVEDRRNGTNFNRKLPCKKYRTHITNITILALFKSTGTETTEGALVRTRVVRCKTAY
jgi:hypothetical protein